MTAEDSQSDARRTSGSFIISQERDCGRRSLVSVLKTAFFCRVLKGAGSQSVMSVNILWGVSISEAFYKVAAKRGQAAQLCVFILGTQYLYLGVLMHVFMFRYVVYVLVSFLSSLRRQTRMRQQKV